MEDQQQQEWPDDKVDEWTALIEAAHPLKTKAYAQWDTAMRMVGNRHSKGALVELVCWLLQRAESASPSSSVLERAREVLREVVSGYEAPPGSAFDWDAWAGKAGSALAEIDRALGGGNGQ